MKLDHEMLALPQATGGIAVVRVRIPWVPSSRKEPEGASGVEIQETTVDRSASTSKEKLSKIHQHHIDAWRRIVAARSTLYKQSHIRDQLCYINALQFIH
jgi:hypothetical protein